MPKDAKRRTFLHERQEELRSALRLIEQYNDKGRIRDVYAALDGEVSKSTVNNWRKQKTTAISGYKAKILLQIKDILPPLADVEKHQTYGFALSELKTDRKTQMDLRAYDGAYLMFHNFEKPIQYVLIGGKSAPLFAGFIFRHGPKKHERCDGLVLIRKPSLYLFGLSETSLFFGRVRAVAHPQVDQIRGAALFEDLNEGKIEISNIVLQRRGVVSEPTEQIREYLERPPFLHEV